MSQGELPLDSSATATMLVAEADLATRISLEPGDAFPPVFATSRMIALMEVAAARAMQPILGSGELSVGVGIDVQHTAPTPLGATVRATARFRGMDGKLYVFDVTAEDEAGEIGRGIHRRAVVTVERLVAGAERRRARA